MTPSTASIRDALLELLAAVGVPPYRSARLLRAVERAHKALGHTSEAEGGAAMVGNLLFCGNCKQRSTEENFVRWRDDFDHFLCRDCYMEISQSLYEQEERERIAR